MVPGVVQVGLSSIVLETTTANVLPVSAFRLAFRIARTCSLNDVAGLLH